MAKEQLFVIVKPNQPVENAKKFMYIEGCSQCMYCKQGQESGGPLPAGAALEQKDIWYFCFHTVFSGWPKRIGQANNIRPTGVLPEFCPLESLISEDEFAAGKKAGKKSKVDVILGQSDSQKSE